MAIYLIQFLILINLVTSFLGPFSDFFSSKTTDVCVVGGGPSGITMGRLLKANNINYQMFEEQSRVGGKALTWRDGKNNLVETGALFFTLKSTLITDMVQQANLTLKRFNGTILEVYNQAGTTVAYQNPTEQAKLDFLAAVGKYNRLRDSYDLTAGYVNAPSETHQSLLSWLKANNMTALVPLFIPIITIQGFGPLDDVPALYVLKLLDLKGLTQLTDFINNLWTVEAGLDVLWSRLANGLNLKYNSKVRYIQRQKDFNGEQMNTLYFANPMQLPVRCKNVVLAVPPYLEKLKYMVGDLSGVEQGILTKIRYNHYISSIVEALDWNSNLLYNAISNTLQYPFEPVGYGETVGILKQNKYYTSYSWFRGVFPSPPNILSYTKIIADQIGLLFRLDKGRSLARRARVVQSYSWEYFPHIETKDINDGWFKKFDNLQGYKNTFYATTLLTFETMNESIDMANHLFQTKILPKFKQTYDN